MNCRSARYKRATTHYWKKPSPPIAYGVMGIARARHLAKDRHEKIAAAQRRAIEGPLPDFVVLGTQRGGTSFFYRLLTKHPLVRGAAAKELHFFDNKFSEGGDGTGGASRKASALTGRGPSPEKPPPNTFSTRRSQRGWPGLFRRRGS